MEDTHTHTPTGPPGLRPPALVGPPNPPAPADSAESAEIPRPTDARSNAHTAATTGDEQELPLASSPARARPMPVEDGPLAGPAIASPMLRSDLPPLVAPSAAMPAPASQPIPYAMHQPHQPTPTYSQMMAGPHPPPMVPTYSPMPPFASYPPMRQSPAVQMDNLPTYANQQGAMHHHHHQQQQQQQQAITAYHHHQQQQQHHHHQQQMAHQRQLHLQMHGGMQPPHLSNFPGAPPVPPHQYTPFDPSTTVAAAASGMPPASMMPQMYANMYTGALRGGSLSAVPLPPRLPVQAVSPHRSRPRPAGSSEGGSHPPAMTASFGEFLHQAFDAAKEKREVKTSAARSTAPDPSAPAKPTARHHGTAKQEKPARDGKEVLLQFASAAAAANRSQSSGSKAPASVRLHTPHGHAESGDGSDIGETNSTPRDPPAAARQTDEVDSIPDTSEEEDVPAEDEPEEDGIEDNEETSLSDMPPLDNGREGDPGGPARPLSSKRKPGVQLHLSTTPVLATVAKFPTARRPDGTQPQPAASAAHTKQPAEKPSRRTSARGTIGKKTPSGADISSDSDYSGAQAPSTSSSSRPSRLILHINKNPLKVLRVNVQRQFFSQQQQKQIEISDHAANIDEAVVTAPVRLMGTPQRENLYFVAKDVCLLIHTRRGNVAKCWGKSTKLLLYDGRTKLVQHIVVGDVLMGDDGTPRTVQADSLTRGNTSRDGHGAATYRVTSSNAGNDSWTCNGDHILVVRFNDKPSAVSQWNDSGRSEPWWQYEQLETDEHNVVSRRHHSFETQEEAEEAREQAVAAWRPLVWQGSVDQFRTFSKSTQAVAVMFQPDAPLQFHLRGKSLQQRLTEAYAADGQIGRQATANETELTAWVIGMWLTDGDTGKSSITHTDHLAAVDDQSPTPIAERLKVWYELVHRRPAGTDDVLPGRPGDCGMVHFLRTSGGHASYRVLMGGILKHILRAYKMFRQRHIPPHLLADSPAVRRQLLAGVIDGDGHADQASRLVVVTGRERRVLDGLVHLSRGLGYSTGAVGKTSCTDSETGEVYEGFRIHVGGANLHLLDTALADKRIAARLDPSRIKSPSSDGFTIRPVAHADYFGFTLDGNGRCLLGDFTVTHNSICQFESDEKARMPVVCPRQNGSFSTHVLSVLTIKGVKHLLGSSRSALAPHVLRWLLAQVDHICDDKPEPPANVPQMSAKAEAMMERGPVHSAENNDGARIDLHGQVKRERAEHHQDKEGKRTRRLQQQHQQQQQQQLLQQQQQQQQQQHQQEVDRQDAHAIAMQNFQRNQQLMQQQYHMCPPYSYAPPPPPPPTAYAPYSNHLLPPSTGLAYSSAAPGFHPGYSYGFQPAPPAGYSYQPYPPPPAAAAPYGQPPPS